MRQAKVAIFTLSVLLAAGYGTFAEAMSVPFQDHLSLQYPGAPRPVREDHPSPYPMTYMDEAAQTLGVKDGHMDFFSTRQSSGYLPSVSAGVDKSGAMFQLRWHPGE